MEKVGSFLNWIGGGITRVAATGLVTGLFLVAFGMTPARAVAYVWVSSPDWLMGGWTRLIVLGVGLVIIGASLNFNRWSRRQVAIDALAEDMSWAIGNLLNRDPRPQTDQDIKLWESDYPAWCQKISDQFQNRAFFTRADQLHFDRLGFVQPVVMSGHQRFDWLLGQLKLKFERLRDVINWSQQRHN